MNRVATIAALTLALVAAGAPAADFVPLAGPPKTGTLVRVEADAVVYRTDGGVESRIPVKELAAIDLKNKVVAPARDAKYDEVELTDGSVLKATQVRIAGKKVELGLLPGPADVPAPRFELEMGALFGLLRGAEEAKNRADWQKLLSNRGKRDLFVIRQAEGLNPLPGTVIAGNDAGDRVTFEREDGQKVSLPLTRATGGLVFNQPPRAVIPPTVCKVLDVFGNVLYATGLEVAGSGVKVKLVCGAAVEYPALAGVAKFDFSQGNLSYLSDLAMTATAPPQPKDEPLELKPAADRSVLGPEIVIDGRKYPKGVSIPHDTTLVYKLDGSYREFKALAGIPDGDNRSSWVLRLQIEVDGRTVFNEPLAKKAKPRDVTLNVKDAKEVRITVTADGLFTGGEISLADARFQK